MNDRHPPPHIGDWFAWTCRSDHFHVGWSEIDEDGDVGRVMVTGALTLGQAAERIRRLTPLSAEQ